MAVEIRERAAAGALGKDLAADYGLAPATISAVLHGRRWPEAGGPLLTKGNTWQTQQ